MLLGVVFVSIYFTLHSYTTSLQYFETIPTYVPAIVLIVTGLLVICFARRKNRYAYLIKLAGGCCLVCALLCVVITVTTTVIHMNRLQTLRECVYAQKAKTCTCFAGIGDDESDGSSRYVFNNTPDCEVVHGSLYACLRAMFGLSVVGILVCIFSSMLVYQLLSHEKKKMYWEQLEMRRRFFYRQPSHYPYCNCCDDYGFAAPHDCYGNWHTWDVNDDQIYMARSAASSSLGRSPSPEPDNASRRSVLVGSSGHRASGWNWLPWNWGVSGGRPSTASSQQRQTPPSSQITSSLNSSSGVGGGGGGGETKPAPASPPRNDSPPPLPAKTRRWADQVQKKNRLNRNGSTSEPSSPPSPTLATLPHQQQQHQRHQQQPQQQQQSPSSPEEHRAMTVAERVLHLERGGRPSTFQQPQQVNSVNSRRSSEVHSAASAVLHEQRPRAGDPSLKAIQKQAVLSFFERQTGITSSRSSIRDRDVATSSPTASTFMPRQSTRSLPRDYYQEFKRQQQLMEAEAASSAALAAAEAAAASMDALVYRDLPSSSLSSSTTRLNSERQQTSYLDTTPSKSSCSPLNVGAVAPVLCQSEAGDEKSERPQSAVEQAHSLPVSKTSTDLPQKSNIVNGASLTEELQRCELRGSLRRSFLTKQGSRCSTPELPLPPPPRTTETEVAPTDEPLPPPPTPEEVDCGVVETKNLSWERMHRPCFHSSTSNLVLHSTLDMVKESSPIREVTQIVTECVSDDDPVTRKGSDSAIEDTTSSSDSPAPDDKRGSSSFSSPFIEVDSSSSSGTSSPTPTPSPVPPRIQEARAKRVEDLEVERLSRDLVNYLPASDQVLHNILVLAPEMKTMSDYMEGIFVSSNALPQRRRRSHNMINNNNNNVEKSCNEQRLSREGESLPADSAYFTTSESKARFLTTYSKDMNSVHNVVEGSNLLRRKEELIGTIARKLDILRAELLAVHEEMGVNDELGSELTSNVERLARINETDKFKLHVEEVEKITNLLLGLSGRLARAENALKNLPQDHNPDEKRILESKRNKLYDQHEEAKKLKENIDRRSVQVSAILGRYLTAEEHEDYNHFIKMKSKLLMDAREIDDKIKLGEEQMAALQQSLLSWCKP